MIFCAAYVFLHPLLVRSACRLRRLYRFLVTYGTLRAFRFSLVTRFRVSIFQLTRGSFFRRAPRRTYHFVSNCVRFSNVLFQYSLSTLPPRPMSVFRGVFFRFTSNFYRVGVSIFGLSFRIAFPAYLFWCSSTAQCPMFSTGTFRPMDVSFFS